MLIFLAAVAAVGGSAANAPSDAALIKLGSCIQLRSTGADRLLTAKWVWMAMSGAPELSKMTKSPGAEWVSTQKDFARMFTRLATTDCFAEVRAVGGDDFEPAFEKIGETLGELGIQELMRDPAVNARFEGFADFINEEDFSKFGSK